jgi:hypothetical protein
LTQALFGQGIEAGFGDEAEIAGERQLEPDAEAIPREAAITGLAQRAGAAMFQARRMTCSGEASRNPRISPPLEKCSPAPRTTMTRTAGSASSASNAARNSSRSGIVITLSGGRSSTTSPRSFSASTSTRNPSGIAHSWR